MSTNDENNYIYCTYCGTKLAGDSKFCNKCGKEVKNIEKEESLSSESTYENANKNTALSHKCPNCGEVLSPYQTQCDACGYFVDTKNLNTCPNCGRLLSSRQTVCDICGCDTIDYKKTKESSTAMSYDYGLDGTKASDGWYKNYIRCDQSTVNLKDENIVWEYGTDSTDFEDNTPTEKEVKNKQPADDNIQRPQKCPNCGEPLMPHQSICDVCGYFIGNMKPTKVAEDLLSELKAIDTRQMPVDTSKSLSKFLFGKESNREREEREEREREFEHSKTIEKRRLIRNYPLPNTEVELIEFLKLTGSMIDLSEIDDQEDVDDDAWCQKFNQTYKKAKQMFGNSQAFNEVQQTYDEKNEEIDARINQEKRKNKTFWIVEGAILIGLWTILLIAEYPIQSAVVIFVLLAVIFYVYKKKKYTNGKPLITKKRIIDVMKKMISTVVNNEKEE